MAHPEKPTRREFLVTSSSVALGAAIPVGVPAGSSAETKDAGASTVADSLSLEELLAPGLQRSFTKDTAGQVAMPVGGIGAGCICFNGYGGLQDFSIWNHPATTALPEGFAASKGAFAILHVKKPAAVTKLIEGPFQSSDRVVDVRMTLGEAPGVIFVTLSPRKAVTPGVRFASSKSVWQ